MIDAKDMIGMLRRHYLPESKEPGGIFAPEIQAPNSTRRADLIWQGCTAAGGHELVGHEVKVTRQDLLVELADPTKSDPWQRYCDRWWLVLPSVTLADGLELPATWGVLTPPSGRRTRSMTVSVPAPVLKPTEQAPALKTLATWLHWRLYRAEGVSQQARQEAQRERERNQALRLEMQRPGIRSSPNHELVDRIVTALGGHHFSEDGDEIGSWRKPVKVEDLIDGMKDLASVNAKRTEAERALRDTERQLGGLRNRIESVLGERNSA